VKSGRRPPGGSRPWWAEEGRRGEQLLDAGQLEQATALFETMLVRLGPAPSAGRAAMLGRLGRCLHLQRRHDAAVTRLREALRVAASAPPSQEARAVRGPLYSELGIALQAAGEGAEARKAHEAALAIARERHDLRAEAAELSHIGALELAEGQPERARERCEEALRLARQLGDLAMEAVAAHQLGDVLARVGQPDDAERHYDGAARLCSARQDFAGAARAWTAVAALQQQAGRLDAAEAAYGRAIGAARQLSDPRPLGRLLEALAQQVSRQPGRLAEARALMEHGLTLAQDANPLEADNWRRYGALADLGEREATNEADPRRKAALQAQARDHREVERQAPRIVAALARLDAEASDGRALVLERLGRCFELGGRPDLALEHFRQALASAERAPGEEMQGLRGALHLQMSEVLRRLGRLDEAGRARDSGLALAGKPPDPEPPAPAGIEGLAPMPPVADDAACVVEVSEDVTTDYVFEPDLLLDGPSAHRSGVATGASAALPDGSLPMLRPGTRTVVDEDGAVRFCLPPEEPVLERRAGYIVMRRARREVTVSGSGALVWRLLRALDGSTPAAAVLGGFAADERPVAARLLAALAAHGVVEATGPAKARHVHAATKKGVLSGGQLESEAVLRLATDGGYREHAGAPRIALGEAIPDRLHAFHALTRARRSRRDFDARRPLAREDFDALLRTACGVTGSLPWAGREVKLRAYPSSGALYAVEIYPIVFRVEGLQPAICHYRAADHALEIVRAPIEPERIVTAALPVERPMMSAVPAMVCLVGHFPRHECKYGQGGYRMMVAEAGHISENLVLAATALGLSARPFGGVFDDLLNEELGLAEEREQFLLAVLVGHAGPDAAV
jgi:SagB-type dehydrogenase family enzyme